MSVKTAVRKKRVGPGRLSAHDAAQLEDRLLDAALAVFSERGFGGATMDQIAKTAGASTKTIYARYADKTEMLRAVLRRLVDRTVEAHSSPQMFDVEQMDLRDFLIQFCTQVAMRIATEAAKINQFAMSEVERVPELKRLHQEGQNRGGGLISQAIAAWHKEGMIESLEPRDFQRAGILCLSMTTDWTRIRTSLRDVPTRKEIEEYVVFAVDMFLKGCGYKPKAARRKRA